jgi:futalosine hydrolase
VLLVIPAPVEAKEMLARLGLGEPPGVEGRWQALRIDDYSDLVVCGVGKVNAAGAVALLAGTAGYGGVVNAGVCGALPGSGLDLGAAVLASPSVYADEGVITPDRFVGFDEMGFPLGPFEEGRIMPDPEWAGRLGGLVDAAGPIATVSTCSGTDEAAQEVVRRTGAICEAMEGAAAGHVAARLGLRFAEVRVVSNTAGDRARQRWDIPGAVARLGEILGL